MPKLAGVVATLENVPEAYQDKYEKNGDVFHLKEIEFDDTLPTKLAKKEKTITETNAKLGRYTKFAELSDDELEELHGLRELKKSGKPLTVDEKADLERLHGKATKKLSDDLAARDEKLTTYERELKRFKLTDPLRAIATAEKVGMFPEDFDLAWSEISSRFKLVEEEGKKARIVVLDEDGDESDIKPEDFFNKLYKQQRPKFFKGSGAGGSGAQNNAQGGKGGAYAISREQARNPATYRAAEEAAKKAGQQLTITD